MVGSYRRKASDSGTLFLEALARGSLSPNRAAWKTTGSGWAEAV